VATSRCRDDRAFLGGVVLVTLVFSSIAARRRHPLEAGDLRHAPIRTFLRRRFRQPLYGDRIVAWVRRVRVVWWFRSAVLLIDP
jgi:hypothetical protein